MTTSGAKALSKVQLGRQSVYDTAVAATTIWRGIAQFPKDSRGKEMPEENIGLTSKTTRQHDLFHLAEMEFPETTASFEQFLHLLEASVQTDTPAQDGTGSGYIYEYLMATGDSNTIKYYTIEGGNNKNAEKMDNAIVTEWTLAGRKKEALKMQALWQGKQTVDTTFTAALTLPTVNAMKFQKMKLYIDNVGGTIGTTQIANSFIDFSLKYSSGWYLSHTGDGNMTPSFAEYVGATATLSMTLLHNATTKAERDLWKSNTPRKIRLLCQGETAFAVPGTLYSYPTLMIDMAGVYTKFDAPNSDDEGASTYSVEFEVGYDTTAALALKITDVVALSAIP